MRKYFNNIILISALVFLLSIFVIVWKARSVKTPDIWVGFLGTSEKDPDVQTLKRALALKKVHGFVLFARNIVNPTQLRALISFLTHNNPLISVAIDQEGGKVCRLKSNQGFLACGAMRAAADYQGNVLEIQNTHEAAAKEMRNLGISVVFGPVADININPHCPAIGQWGQSFSQGAQQVISSCNAVIEAYEKYGLRACLKHAPGHGSSLVDSHKGITDITKTWSEQELEPFIQCFKSHPLCAIMMGHVMVRTVDPKFPASMSKAMVDYMNKRLSALGIHQKPMFITDDYRMKAISDFYTPKEFLDQCGRAGMAVVLFCSHPQSLAQFLKDELDIAID